MREEVNMRLYRISFAAGFAAGFVAGSRAGREKYDQIVRFAKQASEHPAVQQAAGQASTAAQKVGSQIQDKMPGLAQSAAHTIGGKIPGMRGKGASDNGADQESPFAATGSTSKLRSTE
jgi:hypothetical protein